MATFTLSMVFLGNIADLDPVDGDGDAENQSALIGTYYGGGEFAADNIVTVTAQDPNNDARVNSNDRADPDQITYDLGNGLVTTQFDSLFNVDSTVTFGPETGEPDHNGLGGVIQTETGDLFFVMIDDDAGLGANSFDDFPIESIQINSIDVFGNQSAPSFSDDQSFVPCFTSGTQIETEFGAKAVDDLRAGDRVLTLDGGLQTIDWIGRHQVGAMHLARNKNFQPVFISAGALGDGIPEQDLIVSPQHRLMISSGIVGRMTGDPDVLVAAVKLVGFPGVYQVSSDIGVKYHHFACAQHHVVWANGAPAETLYLGPQVQTSLAKNAVEMLRQLGLVTKDSNSQAPARPIVQRRATLEKLKSRHLKNGKALVSLVH